MRLARANNLPQRCAAVSGLFRVLFGFAATLALLMTEAGFRVAGAFLTTGAGFRVAGALWTAGFVAGFLVATAGRAAGFLVTTVGRAEVFLGLAIGRTGADSLRLGLAGLFAVTCFLGASLTPRSSRGGRDVPAHDSHPSLRSR